MPTCKDCICFKVCGWFPLAGDMSVGDLCEQFINKLDVVKAKRGKWNLYGNDDDTGMSYWCSCCNFHLSEDLFYRGYEKGQWIENNVFKYCPNCGAKMNERSVENEND